MYPQKFNPEITTYMQAHGFKKVDEVISIGIVTFRRGDMAVQFWNDRIESRMISPDKKKVDQLKTAFKGFDGQDMFHLMLILHLMDVINLKHVSQQMQKEVGVDVSEEVFNQFNISLPQSAFA